MEGFMIVTVLVIGFYKLIELLVRRKERLMLIEKIGTNFDPDILKGQEKLFSSYSYSSKPFNALRYGCLAVGMGLGACFAWIINSFMLAPYMQSLYGSEGSWRYGESASIAYFAFIVLFGGIGLLLSYMVERKAVKEDRTRN